MQAKRTLEFLRQVAVNNNREWFAAHRDEYNAVRADFEAGISSAIARLADIDPAIASAYAPVGRLTERDCCYRFYRDTRFSPDKSPYKNHMGGYISEGGKKSLRGGYYIHLEWDRCLVAFGAYWLPTNILTACRSDLLVNLERWRSIVERPEFVDAFGRPGDGYWHDGTSAANDYDNSVSQRGFGLAMLKTAPKGFPRDNAAPLYLRMKDYLVWRRVDMDFFEGDAWLDTFVEWAKLAQPMIAFSNATISDYA